MTPLEALESRAILLIREAYEATRNPAVLWSTGKDSTAVLQLVRKAFLGRVPFPVVHLDTGKKLPAMYRFRDEVARAWGLDLVIARNEEAIARGVGPEEGAFECCTSLKTKALEGIVEERGFDALVLAIRRDEHGVRAKERIFSPRDASFTWDVQHQPLELWDRFVGMPSSAEGGHLRVHPILHFTELDVWRYTRNEGLPINPLYFARDGVRYRSLGCGPCSRPVASTARDLDAIVDELSATRTAERSGRLQDKERAFMMQKLRAMGYM